MAAGCKPAAQQAKGLRYMSNADFQTAVPRTCGLHHEIQRYF